jgi:hypothetical protein
MGALVPPFLTALDIVRGVPNLLGLRPTAVTVETRTWSGGQINRGAMTVTSRVQLCPANPMGDQTTVAPYYRVKHVSERMIANSGGRYEQGSVVVGPVTPYFTRPDGTTGGFTEDQLNPKIYEQGIQLVYVLTAVGTTGITGEYSLVDIQRDAAMHYVVYANRMRTTPV